jgi:hypothetical protein
VMISDANALQDVRDGWEFIRESRNVIVGNCNVATFAVGFNQTGIRDLCFNLLLASAFSVLEEVLRQMRDEGKFVCKDNRLSRLMTSSRTSVPWSDYALIDAARLDRNQSVHARAYLPHAKCRDYIAAIEIELHGWRILACTTPHLWHW